MEKNYSFSETGMLTRAEHTHLPAPLKVTLKTQTQPSLPIYPLSVCTTSTRFLFLASKPVHSISSPLCYTHHTHTYWVSGATLVIVITCNLKIHLAKRFLLFWSYRNQDLKNLKYIAYSPVGREEPEVKLGLCDASSLLLSISSTVQGSSSSFFQKYFTLIM